MSLQTHHETSPERTAIRWRPSAPRRPTRHRELDLHGIRRWKRSTYAVLRAVRWRSSDPRRPLLGAISSIGAKFQLLALISAALSLTIAIPSTTSFLSSLMNSNPIAPTPIPEHLHQAQRRVEHLLVLQTLVARLKVCSVAEREAGGGRTSSRWLPRGVGYGGQLEDCQLSRRYLTRYFAVLVERALSSLWRFLASHHHR